MRTYVHDPLHRPAVYESSRAPSTFVRQHDMSGVEAQPLSEVPTDKIMLIADTPRL
jgi:hypothetical protein